MVLGEGPCGRKTGSSGPEDGFHTFGLKFDVPRLLSCAAASTRASKEREDMCSVGSSRCVRAEGEEGNDRPAKGEVQRSGLKQKGRRRTPRPKVDGVCFLDSELAPLSGCRLVIVGVPSWSGMLPINPGHTLLANR